MNKILKIQVNKTIGDYGPGSIVSVDADGEGTPLNHIWRRRLKDAETDQCCEIVEPEEKPVDKPAEKPAEKPTKEKKKSKSADESADK